MGATITHSGKPQLPTPRFMRSLGQAALGEIVRRTKKGISADDKQFAGYSARYLKGLARAGQETSVDLYLTGRLLGSLQVRRAIGGGKGVTSVDIFASTGAAGITYLADGHLERKGSSKQSLNQIGYYLHHGNGKTPARPWLGLPVKVLVELWQDTWDSRRK